MKCVIIESPYAGTPDEVSRNIIYAHRAMLDSINRNEAPFLSHLLYTQVLDDNIPIERKLGIEAGLVWMRIADAVVVYMDYGVSKGMQDGITHAQYLQKPIINRVIGRNPQIYS